MIEALAPLFSGPLAFGAHWLTLPDMEDSRPRAPVACDSLMREEVLLPLLGRYIVQYGQADRRAAVSMWTQYYSAQLIFSTLGANLFLGRALPVRLEETAVLVTGTGTPDGFRISHAGAPDSAEEGMAAFAPLVRSHLQPLFETIARFGKVAPKTLWTNAGVRVAGAVRLAGLRPEVPPGRVAAARALLESPCWPDGAVNPLFQMIRPMTIDGEEVNRRRVCCLRYMLPGVAGCGITCPVREGQAGVIVTPAPCG